MAGLRSLSRLVGLLGLGYATGQGQRQDGQAHRGVHLIFLYYVVVVVGRSYSAMAASTSAEVALLYLIFLPCRLSSRVRLERIT